MVSFDKLNDILHLQNDVFKSTNWIIYKRQMTFTDKKIAFLDSWNDSLHARNDNALPAKQRR